MKATYIQRCLAALALLTCLAGVWRLGVTLLQPRHTSLVIGREPRGLWWAARFAQFRGDLWEAEALAMAHFDPRAPFVSAPGGPISSETAQAAVNALRLSPTRSDLWLLLSLAHLSRTKTGRDEPLEMAYLVGGGKRDELGARLLAAARSPGLRDDTLQTFVSTDLALALTHPAFSDQVAAAFQRATASNRSILLEMISRIDPARAKQMAAALAN